MPFNMCIMISGSILWRFTLLHSYNLNHHIRECFKKFPTMCDSVKGPYRRRSKKDMYKLDKHCSSSHPTPTIGLYQLPFDMLVPKMLYVGSLPFVYSLLHLNGCTWILACISFPQKGLCYAVHIGPLLSLYLQLSKQNVHVSNQKS